MGSEEDLQRKGFEATATTALLYTWYQVRGIVSASCLVMKSIAWYQGMQLVTPQTDHDVLVDHLFLTCRCESLCRICIVQIQPRKHVINCADYAGPTRQHELDHTASRIYLPRNILIMKCRNRLSVRGVKMFTGYPFGRRGGVLSSLGLTSWTIFS